MRREHNNSYGGGGGGNYTELEYLESTGNPRTRIGQFIDTGINPYKITTEIKCTARDHSSFSGSTDFSIMSVGCWNANNNRYYAVSERTMNGRVLVGIHNADKNNRATAYISSNDFTNSHTYIYNGNNRNCYVDGVKKNTLSQEISTSNLANTITLFGMIESDGMLTPTKWRIYYAKFTDKTTGNLVGHFIPVLDSNNEPCMYDLVTEQFFYNQGSGTFLYN